MYMNVLDLSMFVFVLLDVLAVFHLNVFFLPKEPAGQLGVAGMASPQTTGGPNGKNTPTSHTCFNHFLLPDYATAGKMEAKLKCAIHQSEGFGLR